MLVQNSVGLFCGVHCIPNPAVALGPSLCSKHVFMLHRRDVEELFQEELAYTSGLIRKAPHNESAWVYLRGLCTSLGVPNRMAREPALRRLCCEVLAERSLHEAVHVAPKSTDVTL